MNMFQGGPRYQVSKVNKIESEDSFCSDLQTALFSADFLLFFIRQTVIK